jgi:hypothetical protein
MINNNNKFMIVIIFSNFNKKLTTMNNFSNKFMIMIIYKNLKILNIITTINSNNNRSKINKMIHIKKKNVMKKHQNYRNNFMIKVYKQILIN